jgi:hypothetical protein
MKPPIAQRRTTGARPIPRRRRPRGDRAPLRHPLSLLYRQSRKTRTAAPAAVRAADGRAVPLAPRLQIALHLSLTLNEQHHAAPVFAASHHAASAMPAAAAAPTERKASTPGRIAFAAHLARVETACRTPAGARPSSPPSFGPTRARENAALAGPHDRLVYAGSGLRQILLSSGGRPGHRPGGPANHAGATPPWPLRHEAGAAKAASIARDLPGHGPLLVTRLGDRRAVVRPGAATRHASRDSVTDRTVFTAAHRRGGGRTDAAARAAPPGAADRSASASGAPAAPGATAPLYLAESHGGRTTAPASSGSRPGPRPDGPAGHPGVTAPWPPRLETGAAKAASIARHRPGRGRLPVTRPGNGPAVAGAATRHVASRPLTYRTFFTAAQRGGAARPGNGPAVVRAGAAARQASSGPLAYRTFFTAARRGGGGRIGAAARAAPPGAADRSATASGVPAAPGTTAPLYLAERHGGRTTAPASFGSAWAPPPLDFRSAAPPPAAPPPAEARPAASPMPAATAVDLEAVSRDVISRIEKRLRVERERRGRS